MAASASPSLDVSALPGASLSPVIAPAQETSHEVCNPCFTPVPRC
jgi:hypothetical protein